MLADPHGYWLALKWWAVIVGLLIWGMNAPHGALVICASEQDKRAIMALAPKLGRPDVRVVKHDEVLTTDPADCEVKE